MFHFRAVKDKLKVELKHFLPGINKVKMKKKNVFVSVKKYKAELCGVEGVYREAFWAVNRRWCIVELQNSVAKASFHPM